MSDQTRSEMLCGDCGEPMRCQRGSIPYHQCGLRNVELRNVPIWSCSNGHKETVIPAVEQLHRVLADMIIAKPTGLSGPETRFLRKQLGFSSKEFSGYLGISHVSLSRLENGHRSISRPFDRLVRLLTAQILAERENRQLPKKLLPILEELEQGNLDLEGQHLLEHVGSDDRPCGHLHRDEQEWRPGI